MPRDTDAILQDAKDTLDTARLGLDDLIGNDPRRRLSGLRNVVVFGRAVTNVLQNLRTSVGRAEFDEWYLPLQEAMRVDELLKHFYDLRTEVLKEGSLPTATSVTFGSFDFAELQPFLANPPKGAKGFFIGDHLGGSGWEIELPDGSIERYYVALPEAMGIKLDVVFEHPPGTHKGEPLTDTSIEALAARYIEYLEALVSEARERFGSPRSA